MCFIDTKSSVLHDCYNFDVVEMIRCDDYNSSKRTNRSLNNTIRTAREKNRFNSHEIKKKTKKIH